MSPEPVAQGVGAGQTAQVHPAVQTPPQALQEAPTEQLGGVMGGQTPQSAGHVVQVSPELHAPSPQLIGVEVEMVNVPLQVPEHPSVHVDPTGVEAAQEQSGVQEGTGPQGDPVALSTV